MIVNRREKRGFGGGREGYEYVFWILGEFFFLFFFGFWCLRWDLLGFCISVSYLKD